MLKTVFLFIPFISFVYSWRNGPSSSSFKFLVFEEFISLTPPSWSPELNLQCLSVGATAFCFVWGSVLVLWEFWNDHCTYIDYCQLLRGNIGCAWLLRNKIGLYDLCGWFLGRTWCFLLITCPYPQCRWISKLKVQKFDVEYHSSKIR